MKTKVLLAGFVVIIIALIACAVIMSRLLFDVSVDDPKKPTRFAAIQPEQTSDSQYDTVPTEPELASTTIDAAKTGKTVEKKPPASKITPKPTRLPPANTETPAVVPGPTSTEAAKTQQGNMQITSLIGTATATGADAQSRLLKISSTINSDDTIETMPSSRLEIIFPDNTNLKLGENTKIAMEDYCFDQATTDNSRFAMRVLKGSCRVMTGLITKINPSRFKVKTRMATVGIRGCDVAIKSLPRKESIYTLELSGPERVIINAARNGKSTMDMATGKPTDIAPADMREILVKTPMMMVTLEDNAAPKESRMTAEGVNNLISETSALAPAKFETIPNPDGLTLKFEEKN